MDEVRFYSLLYVKDGAEAHANVRGSVQDPLGVYVDCGRLVAKSCAALGIPYAIITNQPEEIARRLGSAANEVSLKLGAFDRAVPGEAKFFSAHYKLDVLRSFGTGEYGDFVGLVDLDVVFVRPPELSVQRLKDGALYTYDLTDVEHAAYPGALLDTFKKLGVSNRPRWFGGEFIVGSSTTFRKLSARIEEIWPRYQKVYKTLHHSGDETIVSAALAGLENEGLTLIDGGRGMGGKVPAVARWWSARTKHKQPSFDRVNGAAIWHLPADKEFLALASTADFKAERIANEYIRHIRRKLRITRWVFPLVNLLSRQKKHLPVLSSR